MSCWVARLKLCWADLASWPVSGSCYSPCLSFPLTIFPPCSSPTLLRATNYFFWLCPIWLCSAAVLCSISFSCWLCLVSVAALPNQLDWRVLGFLSLEEKLHIIWEWTQWFSSQETFKELLLFHIPHRELLHKVSCLFFKVVISGLYFWKLLPRLGWPFRHIQTEPVGSNSGILLQL